MAARHRPTEEFPSHLRALYASFPFDRSLLQDPVASVRPYIRSPRAAEVAGLVASVLAVGNTTSIRRAFADFERRTTGDPAAWVNGLSNAGEGGALRGFRHRWLRGDQLEYLGRTLVSVYEEHGSLEGLFLTGFEAGGFAGGLDALARRLRDGVEGRAPPRGYVALFPSPLDAHHSPCKRLTLFVRWMARPSFPDLGVWRRVPTGELRVPLDQHVYWIAYHLGLTARRSRTWATVEEVTEGLRRIDPLDPVRFDFVLCHTGISGDCPKHRDESVCGPCRVRPDCLLWRGRPAKAS